MNFLVGTRVRFRATFRDLLKHEFDPMSVVATVQNGNSIRTFLLGTGLEHDGVGRFYVDVLLEEAGEVRVRWASRGHQEEASIINKYDVVSDEADLTSDVEQECSEDESPAALMMERRRLAMISNLQSQGIRVDSTRSLAYVEALHDQLAKDENAPEEMWRKELPSSRIDRRRR
jgi:hypothetical protein